MKTNTQNGKGALVYCRVSTNSQEEKGTSLESQERECVKRAAELGYQVKEIVKETFSGAYLFDRPLLNLQREKVRQGEYDAVIVYAIDRLSRGVAHLAIIADEFERAETKLIFVTEELNNTPEGNLMQSVKAYAAEIEREKIRERCVRGKRTQAQNGKLVAATDLYGYETDRINKVRIIKETEAQIVRRIYREYLDGKGIRGIIKSLNDDKIPSPASDKRKFKKIEHYTNLARHGRTLWGKGAVRRILSEHAYCGKSFSFRYKGRSGYEKGKRFHRIDLLPQSEWIALPDSVTPAIVSPAIFQAVQERLATTVSAENTRNEQKPVLLRGLVYCGTCGMKMYPESEHGERNIFRCPSRNSVRCGGKRINADKCEEVVWEKISNIIRNPQTIAAELERRKKDGNNERQNLEADVQSVKSTLAAIEIEIKRITARAAIIEDDFIFETFQEQLKLKKQQRDRILDELADTERRLSAFDSDLQGWESFTNFSNRVAGNLDSFGFDEKRLAFQALGVKITGNGKELKISHSFPVEKQDICNNHTDDWQSGLGQNDAGETSADDSAAARI